MGTSLNPEEHHNCITGSKVIVILLHGIAGDFAYWWGYIGKGLHLQPAQQPCSQRVSMDFQRDSMDFLKCLEFSRIITDAISLSGCCC